MPTNHKPSAINETALVEIYREALLQGHDLSKLERKIDRLQTRSRVSEKIESQVQQQKEQKMKNALPKIVRFGAFSLPIFFILVGIGLISNALMPISEYYLKTAPQLGLFDFISPIPRENLLDITPAIIAQASVSDQDEATAPKEDFGPVMVNAQLDYTNLANWFGKDELQSLSDGASSDVYKLEIPKLDILNANVKIGGTNLDENLIRYPGTTEPGNPGAPVIFGHSVLRQFYNPFEKNPRRYISIFSKIMTLNNGDQIFVEKDGIRYTYKVVAKTEVKPDDVFILTQNYDTKRLKIVTCVPEGTYLRRGVVSAELVE